jgi:hypothetical protein
MWSASHNRFDLVIRVAACAAPDLEGIAAQLRGWSYR